MSESKTSYTVPEMIAAIAGAARCRFPEAADIMVKAVAEDPDRFQAVIQHFTPDANFRAIVLRAIVASFASVIPPAPNAPPAVTPSPKRPVEGEDAPKIKVWDEPAVATLASEIVRDLRDFGKPLPKATIRTRAGVNLHADIPDLAWSKAWKKVTATGHVDKVGAGAGTEYRHKA